MLGLSLRHITGLLLLVAVLFTGCEPPIARYRLNMAYKRKQERINLTTREGNTETVGENFSRANRRHRQHTYIAVRHSRRTSIASCRRH